MRRLSLNTECFSPHTYPPNIFFLSESIFYYREAWSTSSLLNIELCRWQCTSHKYLIHQAVLHTECHTTSWELLGLPEYLLLKASACISYVTGWQWSSVNRGESILTVFHLVQVLIQSGVKGTLSSRWRTLSLILYTSTYGILDNRGPVYA